MSETAIKSITCTKKSIQYNTLFKDFLFSRWLKRDPPDHTTTTKHARPEILWLLVISTAAE